MKHDIVLDRQTLLCRRCGKPCEPYHHGWWRHARPRCGAPMRYGEFCARYAGHADGLGGAHRTPFALANRRVA